MHLIRLHGSHALATRFGVGFLGGGHALLIKLKAPEASLCWKARCPSSLFLIHSNFNQQCAKSLNAGCLGDTLTCAYLFMSDNWYDDALGIRRASQSCSE